MLKKQATQSLDLQKNVQEQLERLMSTFDDLEEYKNELTEEEYNEEKSTAEVQLKEFEAYLAKNAAGNAELTNTINT